MRLPISATLVERAGNKLVLAEARLATERDLLGWTNWEYARNDADRDWDWWSIFQEANESGGKLECHALVAEPVLQGLMLLNLAERGKERNQSLVVDYLATNPANRNPASGLKRVGLALLAVAIMRSQDCGMRGRIWLESLPNAEAFYVSLGFVAEPRRSQGDLAVFTLSESAAAELLEEMKSRDIIVP